MKFIFIKNQKRFVAAGMIAVAAFFAGSVQTRAAEATDCSVVAPGIDQIKAIQNDPTLSYTDEIKAELALRKQLLSETISCAQGDVSVLKDAVDAAQTDGDAKNLKDQLSSKLDDAVNFYTIEQTKVDGSGISGSRAIARELIAWRAGSFDPLNGEANNFVLWTENQDLFSTAQTRMASTEHAVNFLKKNESPSDDLIAALSAAQVSFAASQKKNTDAYNALAQFAPSDQSLTLIKQSLGFLSDTYGHFSDVGTIIKKLLPQ